MAAAPASMAMGVRQDIQNGERQDDGGDANGVGRFAAINGLRRVFAGWQDEIAVVRQVLNV